MKQITNWRESTVADLESTGLRGVADRLHVLSCRLSSGEEKSLDGADHKAIKRFFSYHIKKKIPVIFHNGIWFDIPLAEELLNIDLSNLMVIDTLALSWYLNTSRVMHGLGSFHDDYGIPKPVVGDGEWLIPIRGIVISKRKDKELKKVVLVYKYMDNDLSIEAQEADEEYKVKGLDLNEIDLEGAYPGEALGAHTERCKQHKELMYHRCQEDVKINTALWEDLSERLVDMYSRSKKAIDRGLVGGARTSEDEVTYLDSLRGTLSVDAWVDSILTFLMMKMDHIQLRDETKIELDVDLLESTRDEASILIEEAKAILESVMEEIPQYTIKGKPKNPYLKAKKINKRKRDTEEEHAERQAEEDAKPKKLSASGLSWNEALKCLKVVNDSGHPLAKAIEGDSTKIKVLSKYNPPNAGSSDQIKALLFSHGWKPQTFEFKRDEALMQEWVDGGFRGPKPKPRAIPQINKEGENGKELCPSVLKLAEKVPEIMHYQKYTMIKHRLDMVKGMLRDMDEYGFIVAGCGGLTNTLREKHRGLVNLPGAKKFYGDRIRGSLIAGEGRIMLGSDLSSLEDRTKHHFMLPHDPAYVKEQMTSWFDPHLLMCKEAGLITPEEYDLIKEGIITENAKVQRPFGKTVNYAAVYGVGADTLSKNSGLKLDFCKLLLETYWKLNWAVEAIAEEQITITDSLGNIWLVNPLNGFCYSLRTTKDRFSTLAQGTGSFIFDMWVDNVLESMQSKWGKKSLQAEFHDEFVVTFKDTPKLRAAMEKITLDAIAKVNLDFKLRRGMGCDVQMGVNYAGIH